MGITGGIKMTLTIIFILCWIALSIADKFITDKVVSLGGKEKNPLVNKFGFWTLKIVTLVIGLFVLGMDLLASIKIPHAVSTLEFFSGKSVWFWGGITIVSALVFIWNFWQYKKISGCENRCNRTCC